MSCEYYVVCLTGKEDRMKNVENMKSVLPNIKVIDAFDGQKYTKQDIIQLQNEGMLPLESYRFMDSYVAGPVRGRPIRVGELGAFMSHRKAIEAIANGSSDFAVIFEDDVVIEDDFEHKLKHTMKFLPKEVDIVHLFVFPDQRHYFPENKNLFKTPSGLFGLQCYLVTKHGAKFILDRLKPMLGAIDEMITRIGLISYTVAHIDFIKNVGELGNTVNKNIEIKSHIRGKKTTLFDLWSTD